jgi:hypothetical protein
MQILQNKILTVLKSFNKCWTEFNLEQHSGNFPYGISISTLKSFLRENLLSKHYELNIYIQDLTG